MTRPIVGALLLVLVGLPSLAGAQPAAPWVERPLPEGFRDLYALSCTADAAFGRSWQGRMARMDAEGWTSIESVPEHSCGANLIADEAGVLFTTVDRGIGRYADGAWSRFDAPLGPGYVTQIAAFGDHAVAVGRGRIIAWDGAAYRAYDPGTWRDLSAIWGSSERDLWVAGAEGTALYFDGHHFVPHPIPTEGRVLRLAGRSADDVWAAVEHPHGVFHWDGRTWTERTAGLSDAITAVRVLDDHVLVVGAFGLARGDATSDRWEMLHQQPVEPYAMPAFVDVCVTRERIVLGGRRSTWTRPR